MLRGVAGMGASRAFQQLRDAESVLRSDVWERYIALAQRNALIWWRNRRVAPGLAARFTISGATYYGFGQRRFNPYTIKPYYRVTGRLEQMLLKRMPRTSRKSGSVETRLAFGGGSLNFLTTPQQRPVVSWTRVTSTKVISVKEHTRQGFMKQGVFRSHPNTVPAHTLTRTVVQRVPVRGGDTYAAAFGRFTKDRPVIEARVAIELRRLVRQRGMTKKGNWRASVLRPLREASA
jgi:hypothetical protein